MTKSRPILFSSDMIKALLNGTKTQTRRICKDALKPCPYGQLGDYLWVKETFLPIDDDHYIYKATDSILLLNPKWKSALFMPKRASRITLKITSTRLENLNDISEEDALAEGVKPATRNNPSLGWTDYIKNRSAIISDPITSYLTLWESINGIGAWSKNPKVWIIEFDVEARV